MSLYKEIKRSKESCKIKYDRLKKSSHIQRNALRTPSSIIGNIIIGLIVGIPAGYMYISQTGNILTGIGFMFFGIILWLLIVESTNHIRTSV